MITTGLSLLIQHLSTTYLFFFFFFNDTATTEIYTLSLHDALPICEQHSLVAARVHAGRRIGGWGRRRRRRRRRWWRWWRRGRRRRRRRRHRDGRGAVLPFARRGDRRRAGRLAGYEPRRRYGRTRRGDDRRC